MKMKRSAPWALLATAALALSACSGGGGTTATGSQSGAPEGMKIPDLPMATAVGDGEGQVNLIAWAGYVEDGSTDKSADWVSDFVKETQCKVNRKVAGSSDEMVQLMRTGDYDAVTASGDASLRLIAGGDAAPINTELIPNFKDIVEGLKGQQYNSFNGQSYGIPIGRGANVLMYNKDKIKEAPTSWKDTWDPSSPYKGKVLAYDSPIFIADAAVYLMSTKPELNIKNPYALDKDQLAAAVELLKAQKPLISEYWNDYLKSASSISNGTSSLGTGWQVIVNTAQADGAKVDSVIPKEGATGWSDTWMLSSKSKNPNCAYKWINYASSGKVNAQMAQYFGMSPANKEACVGSKENEEHCKTFHSTDEAYYKNVYMWTTPVEQCLDGRTDTTCTNYQEWTKAWTEIKG